MDQIGHEKAQRFCKELELKKILYFYHIRHQEVISCEESQKIYQRYAYLFSEDMIICRHLVLRERKGEKRIFLIVCDSRKGNIDLQMLKELLHSKKLEFGDAEILEHYLKTYAGNVSIFNALFDKDQQVHMILDQELTKKNVLLAFHPLYNGDTIFLEFSEIQKFLSTIGHEYSIMNVPKKVLKR